MITYRSKREVLKIKNTPYGREVTLFDKEGDIIKHRKFINKKEAAEYFEQEKIRMEEECK